MPEWLGKGIGVGISSLYYQDSRSLSSNTRRFGMQVGTDVCVFCLYLLGTMAVSYLSRLFSKAWHTPRKPGRFMLA